MTERAGSCSPADGTAAVTDLEHRNAAVRVDVGEKIGRARFALRNVIFAPVEVLADECRRQPDLVAIAGRRIFVKNQSIGHRLPLKSRRFPSQRCRKIFG